MDIPVEYSGEMDGPPPHEQARRPECTALRYINDVTAGEIYESRVSSARIPGLYTSRDCFRARAKPRREERKEEHARVKTSPIALPPMHRGTTTYSKLVLSLTNGEKDTEMRNEYGQRCNFSRILEIVFLKEDEEDIEIK